MLYKLAFNLSFFRRAINHVLRYWVQQKQQHSSEQYCKISNIFNWHFIHCWEAGRWGEVGSNVSFSQITLKPVIYVGVLSGCRARIEYSVNTRGFMQIFWTTPGKFGIKKEIYWERHRSPIVLPSFPISRAK